ncbi:hypothetical protein GCM10027344_14480 [Spelaeicoccus albus]|uniref:Uncharacterized protein n=1 Tax=Spelaeicoccus albus TaxID=1280376 RepID=A0A7Z0IJ68_9MICO|nr:hypothetical protein [Spelaeicoccus albus]
MDTVAAPKRAWLKAYRDAVSLPVTTLVAELRDLLGARLVAYLGSVKETRAVRQWADGSREPSAATVTRLRDAYQIAVLLAAQEPRGVVQAWFQGMNPELDDVSPARLLREGPREDAGRRVSAAARSFAATGQ